MADGLSVSRIITGLWQVADMERGGEAIDAKTAADWLSAYVEAGFNTLYVVSRLVGGYLVEIEAEAVIRS